MRSDEIGLRDFVWCWAWALGSLGAVMLFGDLSKEAMVPIAVRAFLWAIPVGIILFGLVTLTQSFKAIPGRWIAAAWIVISVVAGIPDVAGSQDDAETCYDRQGPYSC